MAVTTNTHQDTLIRGDTYIKRITILKTDGTPKDITGAESIRYTMRTPGVEGTSILQKTLASGIQMTAPTVGIIDITVLHTETALLVPGARVVDDCEVTLAGEVMTVALGVLTIVGDVSM